MYKISSNYHRNNEEYSIKDRGTKLFREAKILLQVSTTNKNKQGKFNT